MITIAANEEIIVNVLICSTAVVLFFVVIFNNYLIMTIKKNCIDFEELPDRLKLIINSHAQFHTNNNFSPLSIEVEWNVVKMKFTYIMKSESNITNLYYVHMSYHLIGYEPSNYFGPGRWDWENRNSNKCFSSLRKRGYSHTSQPVVAFVSSLENNRNIATFYGYPAIQFTKNKKSIITLLNFEDVDSNIYVLYSEHLKKFTLDPR